LVNKNGIMTDYKLTEYSHMAGCGCKIAPADLEKILCERSSVSFKELLVGNHSNDDAAVWDLGNGISVMNSVDFFMPIVNDPFDFGRIASANAISDIYAMGGKPLFANALLGWPIGVLPLELANKVMEGALEVCNNAGIPLAGGHSIDTKEPLFGLSVTGSVANENLKRNDCPQVNDKLFLTKALGTGIIGTAIKRNLADEQHAKLAIESMCTLNKIGEKLSKLNGVHALTDVTGFGLIGHLIEMCGNSFSAELYWDKVPRFPFLESYLVQNVIPDNTYRNWNAYEKKVDGILDMNSFQILNDPQTSGGLLIAASPEIEEELVQILKENGINFLESIGTILKRNDKTILVK
jgi:selenide, water dikinase